MSPKKLFIIVVLLALIVGGLFVFLWYSREQPAQIPGEGGEPLPQEGGQRPPLTEPEVKEFDTNFFDTGETQSPTSAQVEQEEVRLMARNFFTSYGSFSTNGGYSHIEVLYPMMTPRFLAYTKEWLKSDPAFAKSPVLYSIETQVMQVSFEKFTASEARLRIDTRRTETDVPDVYNRSFTQQATMRLIKDGAAWKVDEVFWE